MTTPTVETPPLVYATEVGWRRATNHELAATFFVGEFSTRYTFQAIVEGVLIALIIWLAWKWPQQESVEVTP
jgi:hypothetical protein